MKRRDAPLPEPTSPTYARVPLAWGPVVLHRIAGKRGSDVVALASDAYDDAIDALRQVGAELKADGLDTAQIRALRDRGLEARGRAECAQGYLLLNMWADPVWALDVHDPEHRARVLATGDDPVMALGGAMVDELWDAGWDDADLAAAWVAAMVIQTQAGREDGARTPEEVRATIDFFGRPTAPQTS